MKIPKFAKIKYKRVGRKKDKFGVIWRSNSPLASFPRRRKELIESEETSAKSKPNSSGEEKMDLNPNHFKNTDNKIMDLENQVYYLRFLLRFGGDRHQGEGGVIENWRRDRIAGGRSWRNKQLVFELRGRSNGRILRNAKSNYCDGKIFKLTLHSSLFLKKRQ